MQLQIKVQIQSQLQILLQIQIQLQISSKMDPLKLHYQYITFSTLKFAPNGTRQ